MTVTRTLLQKAFSFFGKHTPKSPASPQDTPADVQPFLKRHQRLISAAGLEAGAKGFTFRAHKTFSEHGLTTELIADPTVPYRPEELAPLKNTEAAREWLAKAAEELGFQAQFALNQADSALKVLVDLVVNEATWLGGDAQARKSFLDLPPSVRAANALTTARELHKEAAAAVGTAKRKVLEERVQRLTTARIKGKTLSSSYMEKFALRSETLDLPVVIEKAVDHRETELLMAVPDDALAEAVDTLLRDTRKALVARVADQLRQLSRRIMALPHVELLTDADIAETVAPYYGGLNRALKKRRAKSALVAVEERAREAKYQDDVVKFNAKRDEFADVSRYYPLARTMKRQLVLYVGPTNSGKTWRSLNDLAAAESGAYLAPLRLLALEGQEEMEKRGKPTSFITGEERDLRPGAEFVSSTIEMLNLDNRVGAVVVDEVQMLADERRGWAWLAAVVGAPAERVIMTGSPDCVEIVKDLAAYLGEELTIHECTRHNELKVAPAPMRLREIRPGMAIVCFSRRDVLRLKTLIQENSEHKVAVIYGNLSPQARREEARRFQSGEAAILVATDAIAMGLNLPISEVVFYTTEKFNGEEMVRLTASEIRQIGGRAGRYGFAQFGVVNALTQDDLDAISEAIHGEQEMLTPTYYVAPGHNHIRIIGEVLQTTSLERILTFFERAIEFSDARFLRSNIDDLSFLSSFVDERLPFLDVEQRLTVACAPVPIRSEKVLDCFLNRMLTAFPDPTNPDAEPDDLNDLLEASPYFDVGTARNQLELRDAEDYLKTLTVYAWLAYRYPEVYTRIDECELRRDSVNGFIERSLRRAPEKTSEGRSPRPRREERRGDGRGRDKRDGKRRRRRR